MLKKLFLIIILLFTINCSAENIVVIITDDQRWDQFNQNAMPFTSSIFKKRGTLFKAVAMIPVCCPSRAGIMTGLKPETTGVYSVNQLGNFFKVPKVFNYLSFIGYRCASFGKIINGYRGEDIGFDRTFTHTEDTWHDNINGKYTINNSKPFQVAGLKSTAYTDEAIKFLKNPNFPNKYVQLAYKYPHFHINNLEKWTSERPIKIPESVIGANNKRNYELQVRALREVDQEIKRIFEVLDLKKDLIFFISDNGFSHGEYGMHGKSHPYPEGNYIPLAIINKGQKYNTDCIATNLDIASTILDLKGLDHPTDGQSLKKCERQSVVVQNPGTKPYFRVKYTKDSFELLN